MPRVLRARIECLPVNRAKGPKTMEIPCGSELARDGDGAVTPGLKGSAQSRASSLPQ
ncbi:hypothetical protein AK973_5346 [Pseudomonas brassicacearum]|nr:hypothetical protein AK973_5346 [Pseudomonas brassicacearum]